MTNPADLGVVEAATALAKRTISSRELVDACLARIRERDGTPSFDGDPSSINAWVRVYEDDARAAAAAADERLAHGPAPALCGIPIGLKDLYAVAGKPLTASSRVLDEVPTRDCDVWTALANEGMVLLGHLHTHEFAAGGTTDQVGNPWALDRSPGGSSGGSAAALAARTVPAATGSDTAGSLRIPSAMCGTSTVKPTRGVVSLRGVVPLGPSFDHAGPMARSVADCEPLLAALTGVDAPAERRAFHRIAVSPRLADLDPDVAEGFDTALAAMGGLGIEVVDVGPSPAPEPGEEFGDTMCSEMLVYHRRFDDRRHLYRPSVRGFLEHGEAVAQTAEQYAAAQQRRIESAYAWLDWLDAHALDAVVEPTVPKVARLRGPGYDAPFTDLDEISLTYNWNWTGFPVVSLPSGVGSRTGLPVSVSLIGRPRAEWDLLAAGARLQSELGVPSP